MKAALWALLAGIFVMAPAPGTSEGNSATKGKTYAQALIDTEHARHPELVGLAMHVTPPDAGGSVVVASSDSAQVGRKSEPAELEVAHTGRVRSLPTNGHFEVDLPLQDASARTLGVLSLVFGSADGGGNQALTARAEAIRNELARRISHKRNLFEPAQMDPRVPLNSYAQKLLDEALDQHPDIIILAMHATIPNTQDNVIVASNIGRIGKKADDDDLRVVNTGRPNLEVNETGDRFEAELVLKDSSGQHIGAIGVVYPYKRGVDKTALQRKAEQVRDELAQRIPTAARLFEQTGGHGS